MDNTKKRKMWKKALALLLAFAMIVPNGSVMSALGIGSIEAWAETTYTNHVVLTLTQLNTGFRMTHTVDQEHQQITNSLEGTTDNTTNNKCYLIVDPDNSSGWYISDATGATGGILSGIAVDGTSHIVTLTFAGTSYGTGSVTVTCTQYESGNTSTETVNYTYNKSVDIPSNIDDPKPWTGESITGFAETDDYTVQDGSKTAIGEYTATFTLKDYRKWSDDSTGTKTATWSIGKATQSSVPIELICSVTYDEQDGLQYSISGFTDNTAYDYKIGTAGTAQTATISNGTFTVPATALGDYYFRYAETDTHNASAWSSAVTVSQSYTVEFDMMGHGTQIDMQIVPAGETATAPNSDPTADGCSFGGWYTDADCTAGNEWDFATTVSENKTLYAKWTIIDYGITYYGLDRSSFAGEGNNPNPATYTVENNDIILVNPTKAGYSFIGWYAGTQAQYDALGSDDARASARTTSMSIYSGSYGAKVFTAIWSEISYNVEYDLAGGTFGTNHPSTYLPADGLLKTQVSDPSKGDGYSFAGWLGGNSASETSEYLIETGTTGDVTLTAEWRPLTWTVWIELGDANASLPDGTTGWAVISGGTKRFTMDYTIEDAAFTLPTPTLNGKEFTGWTNNGGNTKKLLVTIPKGTTGNPVYTATWADKTVEGTVTISPGNDGRGYVYGQTLTATVNGVNIPNNSYVTCTWYRSGTLTPISSSYSFNYTITGDDIGHNIFCVATVAGMDGAIRSANTPVIEKRTIHITGAQAQLSREYIPGDRSIAIQSITFDANDLVNNEDVLFIPRNGELEDEYAGNNKPVTLKLGADATHISDPGLAAKYEPVIDPEVTLTTSITAATSPLTTTPLSVQYGYNSILTYDELRSAVSGALGRNLTFVVGSLGTITPDGYVPPISDNATSTTITVTAAAKSINSDTIPEYAQATEELTVYLANVTLISQTVAWDATQASNAGLSNDAVSKAVGSEFTISAENNTADSESRGAITYSSSDTNVAEVDDTGKVTIKKKGTAVIRATAAAVENKSKAASISYTLTATVTEIDTLPEVTSFAPVYTGNGITLCTIPGGAGYKVAEGSSATQTNVGEYTTILELKPGYEWKVGTTFYPNTANSITITDNNKTYPIALSWKIVKQENNDRLDPNDFEITKATIGASNGAIKYTGTTSIDFTNVEYTIVSYSNSIDPADTYWSTVGTLPSNKTISGLTAGYYRLRYKATDTKNAGDSITLWVPQGYKITFVTPIGTAPDPQIIEAGGKVTTPGSLSYAGDYEFRSWNTAAGTAWNFETGIVNSDMTLTAEWVGKTVAFTYTLGTGGVLPEGHPTGYTIGGDPVVLVSPTKTADGIDYVFDGWTATGDVAISTAQKNVTIDPVTLTTHNGITFTANWTGRTPAPEAALYENNEPIPYGGFTFTGESAMVGIYRTDTIDAPETFYYTINGDTPTRASTVYTSPFIITDTTTVKVISLIPGMAESDVATFTFIKQSSGGGTTERRITGINVTPETISVEKGKTATLTASLLPANTNETATITWASSDETVATVTSGSGNEATGKTVTVTGVKKGTAVITASVTAKGGTFTKKCTVTVSDEKIAVTGITVSPETAAVCKNTTVNLTAAFTPEDQTENPDIEWSSSDVNIASVAGSGLTAIVTGIKEGTATITASVEGQQKTYAASCTVTVKGHSNNLNVTVEGFDETTTKGKVTVICPDCGKTLCSDTLTGTRNGDGSYKFTFTADNETYTVNWLNHTHKWEAPSWTWESKNSAKATFKCSAGNETKSVNAVITTVKTIATKGKTQYKATVTGPDNREYSSLKWFDENGMAITNGISIEGLEAEYRFAGVAIRPVISVVDNELGVTLSQTVDYTLSFKDNNKVGTATITVNGKGNYTGKTVTAQFKIVDPTAGITEGLVSKVTKIQKVDYKPTYTGAPLAPEKINVEAEGETITYEWNGSVYQKITDTTKEVGISIENNVNAGTATIAAVGQDGRVKKTTFKINKVDLKAIAEDQISIEVQDEVPYAVKGAVPKVKVTYTPKVGDTLGTPVELIEGQDFKATYKYVNKKNIGEGNIVYITGKGANYGKKREAADKFKIVAQELADEDIISVDAYAGLKAKQVKVVVKDSAGVSIPVKQYTVQVFSSEGLEVSTDSKAKLAAGETYNVKIIAAAGGNLEGDAEVEVTARAGNLGKAKVTLSDALKKDGVPYTGEPIDLTNVQNGELIINCFESGIKVDLKDQGTLEYGTDFEVAGYQDNVKKGTMKVYIRGISEKCSGTKMFKVKISPKTMKE